MSCMLVIEDDDTLREELVELLEAWGVRALGASCGREAISHAWSSDVDRVLCDFKLRLESGLDVLQSLKPIFEAKGVQARCYLMTGHIGMTSIAEDDIARLTDGLLVKPIQARSLKAIALSQAGRTA